MSHQPTSEAGVPRVLAANLKVALVVSSYHGQITGAMADGAKRAFESAGGASANLREIYAPGAWELIALSRAVASAAKPPDAIVVLGCVITGETTHDQYINAGLSTALGQIIVTTGVPIAFGVLTCQSVEQAQARAGGDKGNKGAEAMVAAIQTAATIRSLSA